MVATGEPKNDETQDDPSTAAVSVVEQGSALEPGTLDAGVGQGSAGQGGRPSTYTQDLADEICAQLAEGKSMRKVCEAEAMPAMSTVFKWLRESTEFSEQYARAKVEAADALADDIQDIAEKTLANKYNPNAARVAVDAKKWVASKLKPKVYGDKLDLTSGNEKLNRGMSDAELDAVLKRTEKPAAKGATA